MLYALQWEESWHKVKSEFKFLGGTKMKIICCTLPEKLRIQIFFGQHLIVTIHRKREMQSVRSNCHKHYRS